MKKLLMLGLYGLLILGGSAGASWFLLSKQKTEMKEANEPTDLLTQPPDQLASPVNVTRPLPKEAEDTLPVAVRPGEMSVEEIVRYGLGLKDREALIRTREESLLRTEAQHRLLLADIDGEKMEIGGLMAQARDQRIASEKLLAQAQQERIKSDDSLKQLEDKKQKLELEREKAAQNPVPGADEKEVNLEANIKEVSGVIAAVSPEVAAKILREYANNGQMDMVVEIVAGLEERNSAKILEAMDDEKLASEIVAKYLERKSTVKGAKKKR
jgi:flagellar motility protein MotE (MotC chaperone)